MPLTLNTRAVLRISNLDRLFTAIRLYNNHGLGLACTRVGNLTIIYFWQVTHADKRPNGSTTFVLGFELSQGMNSNGFPNQYMHTSLTQGATIAYKYIDSSTFLIP